MNGEKLINHRNTGISGETKMLLGSPCSPWFYIILEGEEVDPMIALRYE